MGGLSAVTEEGRTMTMRLTVSVLLLCRLCALVASSSPSPSPSPSTTTTVTTTGGGGSWCQFFRAASCFCVAPLGVRSHSSARRSPSPLLQKSTRLDPLFNHSQCPWRLRPFLSRQRHGQ